MVEGLQTGRVVVTDLDGTLVKGNTFSCYVKVAFIYGPIPVKLGILFWVLLRKLRLINHAKMKFALLSLIRPNNKMKTLFVAEIDKMRNSHVARILKKYKESGYEILLATAAPDVYVPWIWDGEFVATKSFNNPQKVECRGEDKLKFIYEKCGESVNIVVVLTDHRDDIPLLKVGADKNIIVNPDVKTLEKLKEEGIVYETLRG